MNLSVYLVSFQQVKLPLTSCSLSYRVVAKHTSQALNLSLVILQVYTCDPKTEQSDEFRNYNTPFADFVLLYVAVSCFVSHLRGETYLVDKYFVRWVETTN